MSVDRRGGFGNPLELVGSLAKGLLVVFIAYLAAIAAVRIGVGALTSAGFLTQETLWFRIATYVLQALGFGIGVALFLTFRDRWDLLRIEPPSARDLVWTLAGVLTILVAAALVGEIAAQFDIAVAQNRVVAAGQRNPELFLFLIPVSLLFIGPSEELVFRGGVQGVLRDSYSPTAAILLASAFFGGIHLPALLAGEGQLAYVVIAALLGLILGYIYERTENLLVPALVHGVYNSVLFAFQYASVTGLVS